MTDVEPGQGRGAAMPADRARERGKDEDVGSATGQRRTIMVLEDDGDLRESFADLLRDHGYEVIAVGDGQRALAHLRSADELPDLMFVDITMPDMDGRAFRGQQLADPRLAPIPVVFTTGAAERGVLDGAPVLQKPFNLDDVLRHIRSKPRT